MLSQKISQSIKKNIEYMLKLIDKHMNFDVY
jgi:hypothetical protein